MVPLEALVSIHPTVGPAIISLYSLYPTATLIGVLAIGFSSGQANSLMEEIATAVLPRGTGYEWTAMS
jgi:HAE1 family hydrophobic/amphiphilic exporter-1